MNSSFITSRPCLIVVSSVFRVLQRTAISTNIKVKETSYILIHLLEKNSSKEGMCI